MCHVPVSYKVNIHENQGNLANMLKMPVNSTA